MKLYRQGDVLLKQVRSIPKTAKLNPPKDRIVLAYGEVTGHAHAIEDLESVDVFVKPDGTMYLEVKDQTAVRHEEHGTIVLPPGKYERVLQREYSPSEIRNVGD
jgi:hypothetical protein